MAILNLSCIWMFVFFIALEDNLDIYSGIISDSSQPSFLFGKLFEVEVGVELRSKLGQS